MNEPVKVLYFVDRMLRGGIQSLVIDWVSRFDKEKIHVDFLLLDDGNKYELEETLKELGCNVYKLDNIWIRNPIDFIIEAKALDSFFKEHNDYKVIHLHSTSKNYLVLKYAKKYGIPIRIAHSHNIDFQTNNSIKKIIGNLLKKELVKYSTDFFACSMIAGEWLFGKNIVESNRFTVIHNAVDHDKYKFNDESRKSIRKDFNINDNEIVVGHVGRFEKQKNHEFLIDVFKKISDENSNYKLLLVGTGSLENDIKEKVKSLNIEDKVIFAGFRNDVDKVMQAMDIFVFPSKFEGLGLVLVEAQASGMPCIATKDTIPKEVKINENFFFVSLNINDWVDQIIKVDLQRIESINNLKKEKYLIEDVIRELESFYLR